MPTKFFKILFDPKRIEAIAFLMPQDENTAKKLSNYVVSIDDIEKLTGYDFLTSISKPIQDQLESHLEKIQQWEQTIH